MKQILINEYPSMEGWSTLDKCLKLYDIVYDNKLNECAEIGTFGAKASLAIGLALKETGGILRTCDPYCGDDCCEGSNDPENDAWWKNSVPFERIYTKAMNSIIRCGVLMNVSVFRCRSDEMIHLIKDNSLELMHADGVHNMEVAGWEVKNYAKKMKSGSYWVADDILWETMKPVKALIENEMKWELEFLQEGEQSYAIYRVP